MSETATTKERWTAEQRGAASVTISGRWTAEQRGAASVTISRRWTAEQRGAASVEAVIMLPFFILILFGVLFAARMAETRQALLVKARHCAWQHSNAGCPGRAPEGCDGVVGSPVDSGMDNDIWQRAEASSPIDEASDIPLVGAAVEAIFGSALLADAGGEVERPPVLGGRAVEVHGRYYLMCNEQPRTLGEALIDAFCDLAGFC